MLLNQKRKKPIAKKTEKKDKNPNIPDYQEITEEEFLSVNPRQRNGVNLDIIRTFHRQLYDYFHGEVPNTILNRTDMPKHGFRTKPDTCIAVLKALEYITLDRSRNIIACNK